MAIVTFIPRMVPLVAISKLDLPEYIKQWLRYIPAAILASLLVLSFMEYSEGSFNFEIEMLMASIPTLFVAIRTKSLVKSVLTGIIFMALITILT